MARLTVSEAGRGLVALRGYPKHEHNNARYWELIAQDDETIVLRWLQSGAIYIVDKEDRTIAGNFYDIKKIPT